MKRTHDRSRRDFLRHGLYGVGLGVSLPFVSDGAAREVSAAVPRASAATARGLVLVELSGGNDGLNTIVPFEDDAYYRARPTLAVPSREVIAVDEGLGLHPALRGFERLYKDGDLAIVHGCGHDDTSLSHFRSMWRWHSGGLDETEDRGWLGRVADTVHASAGAGPGLASIGRREPMALRGWSQPVFSLGDPAPACQAEDTEAQAFRAALSGMAGRRSGAVPAGGGTARTVVNAQDRARRLEQAYRTPVDYGVGALAGRLRRVAAVIAADLPARIFHVSGPGSPFDTHVHQGPRHRQLLSDTGDAIHAFVTDLRRMGRADDIAVLVLTEFGRRVHENASQGTDHGTATPVFVAGAGVSGGMYGRHPSLTDLCRGNLRPTTDYRRVYASVIEEWLGRRDAREILGGAYSPLGLFAPKPEA